MKLYADLPGRRTLQIVADVFVVCFCAVCVWAGRAVAGGIGALRGPADRIESAGDSFRQNMAGAADQVGGIPLVGDGLRTPFQSLSGAGQTLADAGTSLGTTIDTIARVTGLAVALIPIVLVLLVWGLARWRFVRRATAVQRFAYLPGSFELLALRALTRQPLRRLTPLGPDLAARFRAGDIATVRALALLELRGSGVVLDLREPVRPAAP